QIVPALGDALYDGHIGGAQAHEFARAASNPRVGDQIDSVAPLLLQHGEHLGFDEFRVVVRRWETLADLDGAERNDEASHERRTASVLDVDGSVRVRASGGTGMVTAEMMGIFQRFVDAEFAKDVAARTAEFGPDAPASKLPRTDAQRRFDAMVQLFRAAVTAPADGIAPAPVVNVLVGVVALQRILARRGMGIEPETPLPADLMTERMESSTGVTLAPDDVIAACLSGVVRRVVIDSASVVVDAGRKRRLFTGVARELALLLWQRCGHLGCTVPADQCQVDHMDEWDADGGTTDQSNARPRCDTHNPYKSKHRLRSVRDPNGYIVDYRSDGTPMLPAGRRPPDQTPLDPPDDVAPADHHEVWDRLVAHRTAVRSWERRCHRLTSSELATPDGRRTLTDVIYRPFEN
ncbi:MAG TPA: DUF222 domain-containing protein, partial [Ilumatobacteraceae bacterium]|nr:DUF222 domain-containing protein [Ilumatobacteraceae bacterium]